MSTYYNENNPFCASWLENLIESSYIPAGIVDRRSIEEVCPSDLKGFDQCHFFAGIGVWPYALREACWSDIKPVWTGSCPCQPFSVAGNQEEFGDDRDLWPVWADLIRECNPPVIIGEQVASEAGLVWFDLLSTDLEALDYETAAANLCAAGVGAPHIRQRLYWMALASSTGRRGRESLEVQGVKEPGRPSKVLRPYPWPDGFGVTSKESISELLSSSYGPSKNMELLRGYGNSLVAPLATEFCIVVKELL